MYFLERYTQVTTGAQKSVLIAVVVVNRGFYLSLISRSGFEGGCPSLPDWFWCICGTTMLVQIVCAKAIAK